MTAERATRENFMVCFSAARMYDRRQDLSEIVRKESNGQGLVWIRIYLFSIRQRT